MSQMRMSLVIICLILIVGTGSMRFAAAEKAVQINAKGVQVGDAAPEFSLPAYPQGEFSLADAKGKTVVLYFYPKDETPGCTKEACTFRDASADFAKQGAVIWGVSADTVDSHQKFAANHKLPFPLLSDEGGKVRALFGNPGGEQAPLIRRITYVIDAQGIVREIITGKTGEGVEVHITAALTAVTKLAQAGKPGSAANPR
jgi:thioredoxin-dependent peroxiredoxin